MKTFTIAYFAATTFAINGPPPSIGPFDNLENARRNLDENVLNLQE